MDWARGLSEGLAANATGADHGAAGGHGAGGFTIDPTGGALFAFVALIIGAATRGIIRFIPLPYTVVLLILGALIGLIDDNGK